MRFGLCCTFLQEDIKFRTATVTYVKKIKESKGDWLGYINAIVLHNTESLRRAVLYCSDNGIGSFRINSNFLPCCTHADVSYEINDLPSKKEILVNLSNIKILSAKLNIRLSFHPDQFVVLNSPREDVVRKSIAEIEYHVLLANLIGVDTINIHGGGGYNDKRAALDRFQENFEMLSMDAKKYLTVENDDKTFTPEDLLPLCERISIPLVYDVHHHRCNKDSLTIQQATNLSLETWNREPLFHISSPINGWEGKHPNRHHDYINEKDFPLGWLNIESLTVEVEAKAKEVAVIRFINDVNRIRGV